MEKNRNLKIGIVILNYNTFNDTQDCVNSIYETSSNMEDKILIVVDNKSPDGSGKQLEEYYQYNEKVLVILADKNGGYSCGNNIGIKKALELNCEVIFLLNSDVVVLNDIFTMGLEVLKNNGNFAVFAPTVFNGNGKYIQFARKKMTFANYICERFKIDKIFAVREYKYNIHEPFVFSGMSAGCCFAITNEFARKGVLDNNIFMYYEEDVLAYQMSYSKQKTIICPDAEVVHKDGKATQAIASNRVMFGRYNRWKAARYVLEEYANINAVQCKIIDVLNKMEWWALKIVYDCQEKFK